jgi:tetratricopeptide (TPR) repeat protein
MKGLSITNRKKALATKEIGKKFRIDGEYEKAIKKFSESINIDQNDPFAYGGRGLSYALNEQDDLAIADYTKSIEILNSAIAWMYNRRGLCYETKSQYDLAIKDYNEAIKLAPNDPENYFSLGYTYERKEQYDLAIKNYTELIKYNKDEFTPAFPYTLRAYAYSQNEQYDLAINDYNEAVKLEPDNADNYANRGYVYTKLGNKELAKQDFDKAFSLEPENESAKLYVKELK